MRYNSRINNLVALKWGLNIQQAYLFDWIYELPSWAEKIIVENDIFFHASRHKAISELPLLTDKPDTIYRYYKILEEKGLIFLRKIDSRDYIKITDLGKKWNEVLEEEKHLLGNKSEYSEINPSKLGNKSENNSDLNPTNNNIIINNLTSINSKSQFSEKKIDPSINQDLFGDDISVLNDGKYNFKKGAEGFVDWFNSIKKRRFKCDTKIVSAFKARLRDGYTKKELMKATIIAHHDKYHKETNYQYLTPEFILRSDKLNKFLNVMNHPENHEEQTEGYSIDRSHRIDHSNLD